MSQKDILQATKAQIVHEFKHLYDRGMVTRYEGNISVRVGDTILITPSQQDKRTLEARMIGEVNAQGTPLRNDGITVSSELNMHLALYALRPDIGAIVHVHSPYATAFALAARPLDAALPELYAVFGGPIPCARYGTPGTPAIAADFGDIFGTQHRNAALLANHGLVCAGADLDEACALTETAEKLAHIALASTMLGPEHPLPDGEAERLAQGQVREHNPEAAK